MEEKQRQNCKCFFNISEASFMYFLLFFYFFSYFDIRNKINFYVDSSCFYIQFSFM